MFTSSVNPYFKKLLAPRRIEYLALDRKLSILDTSLNVHRFAEQPDEVVKGKDVRLGFPELIGLEEVFSEILSGEKQNFDLKGIARSSNNGSLLYIDISVSKYQYNEEDLEDWLIIFFDDVTEKMSMTQKLVQRTNEANLLVSALTSSKNYIDKIITSIAEVLLVTTASGKIKAINKAAKDLFGYSEKELINKQICQIITDNDFFQKARLLYPLSPGELLKDVEVICKTKNGKDIVVAFSCSAIETDIEDLQDFVYIGRDITQRKLTEAAVQQANEKLTIWVNELEQRNREITLLSELSELLQACLSVEEAYTVIVQMMEPLFPDTVGGVFMIHASKQLVEAVATWGEEVGTEVYASQKLFSTHECWALRRGRSHFLTNTHNRMLCKHLHLNPPPAEYGCIPMMAQGEAIGMLYVSPLEKERLTEAKQRLAVTVAQHIALALANLRLREILKNQSIRDPLTDLFNRRYLKESLEQEIHRARCKQQPLGIIILDIDDFKKFNDTYGHEAGDAVLREVGLFLQKNIRKGDIACRYGGEEFTLILPEAPLDVVLERAQQLREKIKQLQVNYHGQPLGTITLSLGVACFPEHGLTASETIQAADTALYQAKTQGRDRVCVCGS
ncbi:diguanylate cyclase [Funiculus sociatus]|uniref:diguanylate cyclase n=1 Tax=Funiculus sociatus TaxID=450527 RepID=UPI0032984B2B